MSFPQPKSRILNVNDDEANRYAVTRILKQAGYEALEAETGAQAIEVARREFPDLVVLDVKLPDMSGMEVCRVLKSDEITRVIPILHLTAHALATEHKVQSLNAGADAYLGYPVEPSYLLATLASLLKLRRTEREREEALGRERAKSEILEKALEELRREKALREQFLATLTHDLRSPLASIKMGAQLSQRRLQDQDLVAKQLARIIAGCDRTEALIQNLLDASLYRAGGELSVKRERCDLETMLSGLLEELTSIHGDRFVLETEGDLIGAWDCEGLVRVFDNLIQNAIKYGSEIHPVTVRCVEESRAVRCEVRNLGNLIAPDHLKILFEPYTRAPSAANDGRKGWGLGLTLVKALVSAHGGNVEVRSNADEGTVFVVRLPKHLELLAAQERSPTA